MNPKIALAQLDLPPGEPEKNYQAVEKAALEASAGGADILLLPELWASGYDLKNRSVHASPMDLGWFKRMQELSKDYGIALGGSLIEERDGEYFNTFVLLDKNGRRLGAYQKVHLFRFLKEEQYFKAGTQLALIDSPWGKLGLCICYDLRFPEIFRAYAVGGAEIILLVAEWPRKRIAHWELLLQARAVENQCFIAAVNKVGTSMGEKLGGRSAVVDPMGSVLVSGGEESQVLLAEIELDQVRKTRQWMPVLRDRVPEAYQRFGENHSSDSKTKPLPNG